MKNNLSTQIASRLKELRTQQGWSLDRAAKETGVSKAMLGQIEREESNPTIAVLWKIATGFHTSFSSFIQDPLPAFDEPIPSSKAVEASYPIEDKMISATPLFPYDSQLKCEIFRLDLLPGCEHLSSPHESGITEHVIVIDGKMEVLSNGRWHALRKGKGIRFRADQPHGYRNNSSEVATIHNIIHYTKNSLSFTP